MRKISRRSFIKAATFTAAAAALTACGGSSSSTTDGGKDNPGTGSNDVVNVAVAMALVSLAAAGAVAFKKVSK